MDAFRVTCTLVKVFHISLEKDLLIERREWGNELIWLILWLTFNFFSLFFFFGVRVCGVSDFYTTPLCFGVFFFLYLFV